MLKIERSDDDEARYLEHYEDLVYCFKYFNAVTFTFLYDYLELPKPEVMKLLRFLLDRGLIRKGGSMNHGEYTHYLLGNPPVSQSSKDDRPTSHCEQCRRVYNYADPTIIPPKICICGFSTTPGTWRNTRTIPYGGSTETDT